MAVSERKSPAANAGAEPIDVLEALMSGRYSCRAYRPEPVPRATIERVLRVAQHSASWCNSQPWQLVITSGEATDTFREVMYAAASTGDNPADSDFGGPREYTGERLQRRRESGFQLYNTLGIPRGDKEGYHRQSLQNFNFFGAPHVAIVTTAEELGNYGAIDCGLYVKSFMLAAQALGLGTVAQAALARYPDLIRRHFNLGQDRRVVCGITFGFPQHDHLINSYRTSRADIKDVVTFVGD